MSFNKQYKSNAIPLKKWSESVHYIMNYYCNLGVPSPHILSISSTDAIVEFIEGTSLDKNDHINEIQIREVFSLIRHMHSHALMLDKFPYGDFQDNYIRTIGGDSRILSHCDITPENVIFKGDCLTGIIDWELAGPINPFVEFCKSCWLFSRFSTSREELIIYIMEVYGIEVSLKREVLKIITNIINESIKLIPPIRQYHKAIEWRKKDLIWFDKMSE